MFNILQKSHLLLVPIYPLFLLSCASPYSNAQRRAKGESNSIVIAKTQTRKNNLVPKSIEIKAIKFVVDEIFKKLRKDATSSSSKSIVASDTNIDSDNLHFVYVRGYNEVSQSIGNNLYSKKTFLSDINKYKFPKGKLEDHLKAVKYISMAAIFKVNKTSGKPMTISLLEYSYPMLKAASYKGLGKLEQKKQAISLTLTPPINAGDPISLTFPIKWDEGKATWFSSEKVGVATGSHAFMPITTTHTKITVELIESSDIEKHFDKLQEEINSNVGE